MLYTFRKLNSTDIFKMIRVIKKLNIKELGSCFDKETLKKIVQEKKEESQEIEESQEESLEISVGIDVILRIVDVLLGSLEECENELYDLLSNCSNLSIEQIKALDINIFLEMIIDFLKKEELKDFIEVALKLMKLEK